MGATRINCPLADSLFGDEFKMITLAKTGFNKTRFSVFKWSKRAPTSLLVPGHDPPVDITRYVECSRNPGPNSLATNSNLDVTPNVDFHVKVQLIPIFSFSFNEVY